MTEPAVTVTTDPVALAAELVAIDSVNPSLVPGAAGEREAADFCADWLADRGFEITRLGTAGRPSIVAVKRGPGGRSVMLNGHLDTVAATPAQLVPAQRDGRLYGRGAFDMKSGVAALMVAAAEAQCAGDVIVALVADEEFGSSEEAISMAVIRFSFASVRMVPMGSCDPVRITGLAKPSSRKLSALAV